MGIIFSLKTQSPELILKDEYPLYWWGEKNTATPDEIGLCSVQVKGNEVICNAEITTGGIKHSFNDIVTAEFNPNEAITGKYEPSLLFRNDADGHEYLYGFCLS